MTELKNRLKSVMGVQTITHMTEHMNKFIIKEASSIPNTKITKRDGNIYVSRGKADVYPCVVAHTDTVHDMHKEFHVLECEGAMLAVNENYERVGIGGDDKVGIFIALETLRSFENCKVAFFRDEEIGCHGSRVADMKFFKDVAFVLQCDRRGYDDFVSSIFSSEMYSKEFSNAIQDLLYKYGRVESDGGLTDVYQLTENGLEVCVANMSCGYYDPHDDNEYIIINEVFSTLDLVKELCNNFGDTRWEMKSSDRVVYKQPSRNYTYGKLYDDFSDSSYRRYGGGYEKDTYGYEKRSKKNFGAEWLDEEGLEEDRPGYLINNATCKTCKGHEKVHYDEYMDMYFCFGCDDYISEDGVEFYNVEQSDTFLDYIDDKNLV